MTARDPPNPATTGSADYGALALVVVGAIMISMKGILAKLIYAQGVSVEALLVMRAWIALPMVWLWAGYRVGWSAISNVPRDLVGGAMLAGFACYYFGSWLNFVALSIIDASLERVLLFSYPAMVVMARALLARRWPGPRTLVAMLMTYAGIIFAVGGFDRALWDVNGFGSLLVLASAASFAYYMMANERVARSAGSVAFIVYATLSAALALGIHFILVATPADLNVGATALALILFMTLVTNVIPLFMLSASIRRIGAQRAAIISSIGPPATIVFAMLLLGEIMQPGQLAGAALIVAGIVVLEARREVTPGAG